MQHQPTTTESVHTLTMSGDMHVIGIPRPTITALCEEKEKVVK